MKQKKRIVTKKKKYNQASGTIRHMITSAAIFPGCILLILLPVCALARQITTDLGKYAWFPDGDMQYDFFLKTKSDLLLILALWMCGILLWKNCVKKEKIRLGIWIWPIAIYLIMAWFSTFVSVNPGLSVKGIWDGNESILVLTAYLIVFIYFMQMSVNEQNRRSFLAALGAGGFLQITIGIGQIVKLDFWQCGIGRALLTLGSKKEVRGALQFSFGQSNRNPVYMGSYNPNYAGIYCLLLLPLVVGTFLNIRKWRVPSGILIASLTICMIGSGSKTAMAIGTIMFVIGLFLFLKRKWVVFPAILLLTGIFVQYDIIHEHVMLNAIRTIPMIRNYTFQEMIPGKDGVYIKENDNRYRLKNVHDQYGDTIKVEHMMENGDIVEIPVEWEMEGQCFCASDNLFSTLTFDAYQKEGTDYLFVIYKRKESWCFIRNQGTNGYQFLNKYGKIDEIIPADAVWKGHERIFTGRGYIWTRTIPLLKHYLFTGSGPDTFLLVFPQQDYLAKGLAQNHLLNGLVSKPHNMYLQNWVQTGLISMLAQMTLFGIYIVCVVKKIKNVPKMNATIVMTEKEKEEMKKKQIWRIAILFSVVGYLCMGLLNDSCVATAPVFWAVLGLGFSSF